MRSYEMHLHVVKAIHTSPPLSVMPGAKVIESTGLNFLGQVPFVCRVGIQEGCGADALSLFFLNVIRYDLHLAETNCIVVVRKLAILRAASGLG